MPPTPNDDNDDRYRRVLDEFGKFARDFQDYKLAREKALNELEQRLVEQLQFYWRATAAALRQMSDWSAQTEDQASKERATERWIRRGCEAVIILLLLLDVYLRVRGDR